MLRNLNGDVIHGLRSLRKNPILSLTAVLTLALGIGANTAIFTLLYGLVLRSLPTPQAWQLVKMGIASAAEPDSEKNASSIPYRMLQAYEAEQTSFRELSQWSRQVGGNAVEASAGKLGFHPGDDPLGVRGRWGVIQQPRTGGVASVIARSQITPSQAFD